MYCNVLEFRLDKLIKIIIGRELGPLFYAQRVKESFMSKVADVIVLIINALDRNVFSLLI